MSVRVLLRLGGAVKKNRLCKEKILFKYPKAHLSYQKKVIIVPQFLSARKSFLFLLKRHFFYKGFCNFLCVLVLCVRLSLTLCSLRLTVFFPQLPEVQCPNFLDILNFWGEIMERKGFRFELLNSKVVYNRRGKNSISTDF